MFLAAAGSARNGSPQSHSPSMRQPVARSLLANVMLPILWDSLATDFPNLGSSQKSREQLLRPIEHGPPLLSVLRMLSPAYSSISSEKRPRITSYIASKLWASVDPEIVTRLPFRIVRSRQGTSLRKPPGTLLCAEHCLRDSSWVSHP